jgi:hypothetical protein
MVVHRYESTKEEVNKTKGPVIFLAGPTVRGNQLTLQPSWRFEAIDICKKLGFEGSLIIPEFTDIRESDKGRFDLPLWEHNGLKRADCVLFWINRSRELWGLNTNSEQGLWLGRSPIKLVYGRPDDAFRIHYNDIMWNEIMNESIGIRSSDVKIYNTLEDTIKKAIIKAYKIDRIRNSGYYKILNFISFNLLKRVYGL